MAVAKRKTTARRRSPARPAVKRRRTTTVRRRTSTRTRGKPARRTITLPGGLKVNVNQGSISISTSSGPLSGTWSSTGRKSAGIRLPGGVTVRRSG